MKDIKVMWGDTELIVDEVSIDYEDYEYVSSAWHGFSTRLPHAPTFNISGKLPEGGVEMSIRETTSCDELNLAIEYRTDAQGSEFAELHKAGIIRTNGMLTGAGKELLLEILADKYKTELLKAAKAINKEK